MPKLEHPASYYTPDYFRAMSPKDLRKWYSANRSVAQKRIQRLQQSEFATMQDVRNYRAGFPKLADVGDARSLVFESARLARFLTWRGSTLKGQREMAKGLVEGLAKAGAITGDLAKKILSSVRETIRYHQFIQEAKDKGLYQVYGSEVIIDAYNRASAMGINPFDLLRSSNPLDGFIVDYEIMKVKEAQVGKLKAKTARNIKRRMDKVDADVEIIRGKSKKQLEHMLGTKRWVAYTFVIEEILKQEG